MGKLAQLHRLRTLIAVLALLYYLPNVLGQEEEGEEGDDANADGWEFSNNLFSDLGPLLALFGEPFATQYMSSSMTWEENVVFAMAPLGVLTAVIGSIRVGGPAWMKSIIGRARENRADAEIELTSSTSHEVCELYNGDTIVRLMGTPEVQEFIQFEELADDKETFGIYTLREAVRAGMLRSDDEDELEVAPKSSDEKIALSRFKRMDWRSVSDAPNISLNTNFHPGTIELRFFALFGLCIQIGVLVVAGFIDRLVPYSFEQASYAFPLFAAGTCAFSIGQFICASVVDSSTKERRWTASASKKPVVYEPHPFTVQPKVDGQFRTLWLQRAHEVSDQSFESFAILNKTKTEEMMTSTRAYNARDLHISRLRFMFWGWSFTQLMEFYTLLGTVLSLSGFVCQFVGFRSLHWGVSIAQLVATSVMTCVRAFLRRSLSRRPLAVKTIDQHELDWLATRLSFEPPRGEPGFWERFEGDHPSRIEDQVRHTFDLDSAIQPHCVWTIKKGIDAVSCPAVNDEPKVSKEQQAILLRRRIGYLCQWTSTGSSYAAQLASVLEKTLSIALEDGAFNGTTLYWTFDVKDRSNGSVSLKATKRGSGFWSVDALAIDALLSLLLYHATVTKSKLAAEREEKEESSYGQPGGEKQLDWLREGNSALSEEGLAILGPSTHASRRDARWWVRGDAIGALNKAESQHLDSTASTEIEDFRVIGFSAGVQASEKGALSPIPECCQKQNLASRRIPSKREYRIDNRNYDFTEFNAFSHQYPSASYLALEMDTELPALYSHHIFASLIWAIAPSTRFHAQETDVLIGGIPVSTNAILPPNNLDKVTLQNSKLNKIAQTFENADLGTAEEALAYIVPPLSNYGKLPVEAVAGYIWQQLAIYEKTNRFVEAASYLENFLMMLRQFGPSDRLKFMGAAITLEFMLVFDNFMEFKDNQAPRSPDFETFKSAWDSLTSLLKSYEIAFPGILGSLYKFRGLEEKIVDNLFTAGVDEALRNRTLKDLFSRESVEGLADSEEGLEDADWRHQAIDMLQLSPLHVAIIKNEKDIEQLYNEKSLGRDLFKTDILQWTALHYAVNPLDVKGNASSFLTTFLMDRMYPDIDPKDLRGWTPLHYAVLNDLPNAAKILIDKGADFNIATREGFTPLHLAAEYGCEEIIDYLLSMGANIELQDNRGFTPLHCTAADGTAIEMLILQGANKEARDKEGRTPLHVAVSMQNAESTEELLNDGAKVNTVDNLGKTPLHTAAITGNLEIAEILIKNNADLNVKDVEGLVPLHYAAHNNKEEVVRSLLQENAISTAGRDSLGHSPLSRAIKFGSYDAAMALIEADVPLRNETNKDVDAFNNAIRKGGDFLKILLHHVRRFDQRFPVHESILQDLFEENAEEVDSDVLKLLSEHGHYVQESEGAARRTVAEFAREEGYEEIAAVLEEHHPYRPRVGD